MRQRGFTLFEMLITLALVALIYTMISTILVQIARYVRIGREVAEERHRLLTEVETLRYQLRTLYLPDSAVGLKGERTPEEGRDWIRFLTTSGRNRRGVVEVGYKVDTFQDPVTGKPRTGLFYREFPFARAELRSLDEQQEGPWQKVLDGVETFSLEYTSTGQVWQKEWEATTAPQLIRIRMIRRVQTDADHSKNQIRGDRFVFEVTPGVGAKRW